MHSKLANLLNDPKYSFYLFRKKYLSFVQNGLFFAHDKAYRSDSENGDYLRAVNQALNNQKTFERFKRNPAYQHILEHVTKEQGAAYLSILNKRPDSFLQIGLNTVLLSDDIGQPKKYRYEDIDQPLSPTTLRYIKVASDLLHLFGKEIGHVAEIGCGYGGQCLINEKLLSYQLATLFDLPSVTQLIQRYLNYTLMEGAYEVSTINEKLPASYDLVISNYAFSELPSELQKVYIKKVLSKAKRGYLTMNSGIGGDRDAGKLSLDTLRELLPAFECIEEEPLSSNHNYIITWGHNADVIDQLFTRKITL